MNILLTRIALGMGVASFCDTQECLTTPEISIVKDIADSPAVGNAQLTNNSKFQTSKKNPLIAERI